MVENIYSGDLLLAILVTNQSYDDGVHFITPDKLSQQLAYIKHSQGKVIEPHIHNPLPREVLHTQEVLILQKGLLRVDFYDNAENYIKSRTMSSGDVIILVGGGHGFEVLQDVEMIEVKQGPYAGEYDKRRFGPWRGR